MSLWFRFYSGVVDDPKAQMLPPELFKFWVNMLCLAAKHDGALPPLPVTAFALRVTEAKASEVILRLHSAALLDKTEDGFKPHNWDFRQFKGDKVDATNADRQRRFREKHRAGKSESNEDSNANSNGVTPVTAKRPEYRVQNTETDKKKDTPLRSDDWPDDYGDQFWKAYPRKTEKLSAMKKLATLRKSGIVTFADLIAGVKRYAAATSNTEPKYVKQPPTWLNAGCWADEIQTGGSGGQGTRNTHKTGHDAMFAVLARKAREIAGDGEMARPTDAGELPLGNGTVRPGAQRSDSATESNSTDYDGGKSGPRGVLEGEVIAPGETHDGLPGNWRHH
jgi:hypothetical protein